MNPAACTPANWARRMAVAGVLVLVATATQQWLGLSSGLSQGALWAWALGVVTLEDLTGMRFPDGLLRNPGAAIGLTVWPYVVALGLDLLVRDLLSAP